MWKTNEILSFILFYSSEKLKWLFFDRYIYAVIIGDRNTIDMISKDKLRTEHQAISAFIWLNTTWRHQPSAFFFFVCTIRETRCTSNILHKAIKDRDMQWAVDQHLRQQKQRLSSDRLFIGKYATWLSPYTLNRFLLFISKFWTIMFLH